MTDPSLEAQVQNLEARLREAERELKAERGVRKGAVDAANEWANRAQKAEADARVLLEEIARVRADREQAEKALADCMRQQGSPYVLGGDVLPENVAGVSNA